MIKVDPLYVHTCGYTVCVDGNGGEEQLVVIATTRQDGKVSYHIESVNVDGACHTLAHGLALRSDFCMTLAATLSSWCGGATAAADIKHVELRIRVLKRILDNYNLSEG